MPIAELLRLGRVRAITRWGDRILYAPARSVIDFGSDLQLLLADMFATNTAAHGARLAAQQIGVDLAVFSYDCPDENGVRRTGLICNPELDPSAALRPTRRPLPGRLATNALALGRVLGASSAFRRRLVGPQADRRKRVGAA